MQKRTSAADSAPVASAGAPPMRVVLVTMDSHLASAAQRANRTLARAMPGLTLSVHAAAEWGDEPAALERCKSDIARGDIVIATMLFMEDHFLPVLPALLARRDHCDAMVCAMSAAEVTKLTRMGKFDMSAPATGAMAFLKKLRGKPEGKSEESGSRATAGAQQMKMLRRLPKILRFIPGTAQDVRAYFLALQYWLAGSEQNIANMVHYLVDRYAQGPRKALRGLSPTQEPVEYPEVGLYHPKMQDSRCVGLMARTLDALPKVATTGKRGTVGVLLMRSYVLAGNADHYNGVITALESRGLRVIPAFATGLDQRPAIDTFFYQDGRPTIDALVSLTGFSLIGGPAYNDAKAAEDTLAKLDVPYIAVTPVEFQTLDQWGASPRGLLPVEATMMVAIPELDGATGSMVFGGRGSSQHIACTGCAHACKFENVADAHDMHSCVERADALAARVGKLVDLRRSERAQRKVAAVVFNFPPNAGATGTAAFLSVFESLFNTMKAMQAQGYTVDLPRDADTLRERIIHGNAERFGAMANVFTRIGADEHVRREKHLKEIEAQWGPAPGKQQSDGSSIFVLGERFGNVFVGIQPAFGYEGDPMRLLFEKGFAPTHAFSAFYRWMREDFGAHAVLHFGTHGALEFMPGKQNGMSAACWPDRLIGDLPNMYLYASNNPSEGTIAKRRAAATLISYLTPPVAQSGLYKGLVDLKGALERYRSLEPEAQAERDDLARMLQAQAAELDLAQAEPAWGTAAEARIAQLAADVLEVEYTLIPYGLHVVGEAPSPQERVDLLLSCAQASLGVRPTRDMVDALVAGQPAERVLALQAAGAADAVTLEQLQELARIDGLMAHDQELNGILRALDGRFLRPAPGGDLLRTPAILPTGRNLHGFDPFRIPSQFAVKDGARQALRLLDKHMEDGHAFPESIAMVLWGTDNLKSEGGPIAQVLALMGAPRGRRVDVARRTGPAACGRGDHIVRNLPRPAALADQAAGRGCIPGRERRRTARAQLHPQTRAGLPGRAWGRHRNCVPAGVRQCRGCLRLERQQPGRQQPLGRRRRARRNLQPPQGIRLWPRWAARPATQVAAKRARGCRAGLPEPRLGGAGRHHGRHLLRHAGWHQPSHQARQGPRRDRGAGLHRRPDARQQRWRHRAHAERPGGPGNPHPHAQPQVVRRPAQAWLRGRAPDRTACDQHHGLVGHHRPGAALGL